MLGWWWIAAPAVAGPLTWVTGTGSTTSDEVDVDETCPRGQTVVGGGATMATSHAAARALESTAPIGTSGWSGRSVRVPLAPAESTTWTVSALCATPAAAACVERVETLSPLSASAAKTVVATCPDDTFAFAGGAEILGETSGRGFRRLGPAGFLVPFGWMATVEAYHDAPSLLTDWGVRVVVWCAPAGVFADHVTAMAHATSDWLCIDSPDCVLPGYTYAAESHHLYGSPSVPAVAGCDEPLSVGLFGDPGRFVVGVGPQVVSGLAGSYRGDIGAFQADLDSHAVGLCADDLADFGADLESCSPDGYALDLDRWRIGGTVLWGLTGGGDGAVFLPGDGVVPVDPEPFRQLAEALPVAVIPYADREALDRALTELVDALTVEREAFVETDAVEDALVTSDLLLVVPQDEARAIAWLSDSRDVLAARRTPVVVFVAADGPGIGALRSW